MDSARGALYSTLQPHPTLLQVINSATKWFYRCARRIITRRSRCSVRFLSHTNKPRASIHNDVENMFGHCRLASDRSVPIRRSAGTRNSAKNTWIPEQNRT